MGSYRIVQVLVLMVATKASAVQITHFHVPKAKSGEAFLDCQYNLEGSTLYGAKWYKDGEEFFRCLPNNEVHEYQVDGVKIYHSGLSYVGKCQVTLTGLSTDSAGEYKCEVTVEGPSFSTAVKSARLYFEQPSARTGNDDLDSETRDNHLQSGSVGLGFEYGTFLLLLLCYLHVQFLK